MSGSSAKNYAKNGEKWIIGGELEIVGEGTITKDGQPVVGGDSPGVDIPDGSITDAKLANPKVNKAGDTMTGGLKFDSGIATSATDLSQQINFGFGDAWGISVTNETVNFVAGGTTDHVSKFDFVNGTNVMAMIGQSITDPKHLTTKAYVDNAVSGVDVAWDDVTGKPTTFAPTIGTTATTAKAGNYQPTAANISDASAVGRSVLTASDAATARTAIGAGTSSLALGTTASTAAAGNHTHNAGQITATAIAPGTATDVQGILEELAARIAALEGRG